MNLQLFAEEKREQPTKRRRDEARQKGQVARSPEVGVLATLVAGVLALRAFGPGMIASARNLAISVWSSAGQEMSLQTVKSLLLSVTLDGLKMVLPIMVLVFITALAAELGQVGLLFTTDPVAMDLSRLDPIAGLGRMFSRKSLLELLKAFLKFGLVSLALWQVVQGALSKIPELMGMPLLTAASWGASITWSMVSRVAFGLFIVASADYFFQRHEHEQNLMMSRQELLEEMKQTEGRPELRQRIRSRQRQMAMGRMIASVKSSDVVVANPEHFAVALKYDGSKMAAPQVTARGSGWLCQRIKDEARKHDVAIVENPPVARALYFSTEVGQPVPPALYHAVAEIMAFVFRLKSRG